MVRPHSSLPKKRLNRGNEILRSNNAGSYLNTSRETRSNSSVAERVEFLRRARRLQVIQINHLYTVY